MFRIGRGDTARATGLDDADRVPRAGGPAAARDHPVTVVRGRAWDDPDVQRLDGGPAGRAAGALRRQGGARDAAVGRRHQRRPGGAGRRRRRRWAAARSARSATTSAEVKRMYVAAGGARARGGEGAARPGWRTPPASAGGRRCGWRRARGSPRRSGCTRAPGYRPIAAFGAYVDAPDAEDSLFFERVLDLLLSRAGRDAGPAPGRRSLRARVPRMRISVPSGR